jgi:hypothetical protein
VIADALKCIVWGGRALVIGFAGGEIEKVRGVTSRRIAQSGSVASTATSKFSTSQKRFGYWHLLGILPKCDTSSVFLFRLV